MSASELNDNSMSIENAVVFLGDFRLLGLLSRGVDETSIFKASDRDANSQELYAVKMIPKSKRMHSAFLREMAVLKEIATSNHSFVVQLISCLQTPKSYCLVFEYLENGSLRHHLDAEKTFEEQRTVFYAASILCALQYLHCSRVTHGDVYLRNMMLDRNGRVKLIDFGRSHVSYEETVFGTERFFSDFRQLGLSVYEMLTGEFVIYPDMSLIKENLLSPEGMGLIKKLLTHQEHSSDAGSIEDAKEFLNLQFFQSLSVTKLEKNVIPFPAFNKLPEDLQKINLGDIECYSLAESNSGKPEDLETVPLEECRICHQ